MFVACVTAVIGEREGEREKVREEREVYHLSCGVVLCRVLFVGRLCHSFTDQCPHVNLVMDGSGADYKSRGTPRLNLTSCNI